MPSIELVFSDPLFPIISQTSRKLFRRYCHIITRVLGDVATIAAAASGGIGLDGTLLPLALAVLTPPSLDSSKDGAGGVSITSGELQGIADGVQASLNADWGTTTLIRELFVVRNDVVRLESVLPELSPRDRYVRLRHALTFTFFFFYHL